MFDPLPGSLGLVAVAGDRDLAGLVWVDPADWEPPFDSEDRDADGWDTALQALVAEGIAESDALAGNPLLALDDRDLVDLAGQAERDLRAATTTRQTRARTLRSVHVEPGAHGMAWLMLHVTEAAAWATYERIDTLALSIPDDPDDDRTLAAKRADVAIDLLLTTPADAPPVPINLQVILDHTGCDLTTPSHRGLIGEAGRLGALTPQTIRDLLDLADQAGAISGVHAVPQPCPGQDVHDTQGPGPYQPPDKLRTAMQARDRTCRFAGCNQPARTCQLDHTLRHPDGPTCSCNLVHSKYVP